MSATNKLRNKLQRLGGRAKETIGRATGNRNLENRGVGDQVKSDLKDTGEKVKDAFRDGAAVDSDGCSRRFSDLADKPAPNAFAAWSE